MLGAAQMTEKYRIVVADDDEDIRQLLELTLLNDGRFEVVGEASSGLEVVALAVAHQPHAVLLDLAMPWMTGSDAIAEIKRVAPNTKIVLFSGTQPEDVLEDLLNHGADGYVLKQEGAPQEAVSQLLALLG